MLFLFSFFFFFFRKKILLLGYIYHHDYDNNSYDNGGYHHYYQHHDHLHQSPPSHIHELNDASPVKSIPKELPVKEALPFDESKVALVAPSIVEKVKAKDVKNIPKDVTFEKPKVLKVNASPILIKTKEELIEEKNQKINNLELTKIELEYKLKEKQQLLEIELLRRKLEETERAMANIISKMETIPHKQPKVSLPTKLG